MDRRRERAILELKRFPGQVDRDAGHADQVAKVFFYDARFPDATLDNLAGIPELQTLLIFHAM